jgi:predicted negative regulator of RcsB-dependent stress response
MAKHPAARRVHRAESDEDVFVTGVLESSAWLKTHGRYVLFGGTALVVATAALVYWLNYRSDLQERAAAELTPVRQTVVEGNRQLAMRDLKSFVGKYGSTPSADEARLLLAQIYVEEGRATDAIKMLEPVADPSDAGGASGALLLGAAYEAAKQLERAEQAYLEVADAARFGFEKREGLERAAILRLQKGNAPGAAELYDRALKTLPEDSPERSVYQMRIAEIRAAGAPTGS